MNSLLKEILPQVAKYCEQTLKPHMAEDDEQSRFRLEFYQGLGDLGLGGITISEDFGGAGLGYQEFSEVLRVIARTSVPYAVTLSVSTMVQAMIDLFGTEKQKQSFLPSLTSGAEIAAFALSEAGSGSDAASLKTKAIKVDGGYELTGNKMWITSGGVAKTYLVMARTGVEGPKGVTCFLVRDGVPGFTYGKLEHKMGWKTSPTRELVFNRCFVPEENILGNLGEGFKIAMAALNRGRITIGAIAVGLSEIALEEALRYSLIREQFGQSLFHFQGLQFMLSDMACELECSRLLVQKAASDQDLGISDQKLAAMAKMKATDTAMRVTTDAVQILGGVGYTTEYPLERYMRDAKVLQIVEGTNQIQKIVIARSLQKELR